MFNIQIIKLNIYVFNHIIYNLIMNLSNLNQAYMSILCPYFNLYRINEHELTASSTPDAPLVASEYIHASLGVHCYISVSSTDVLVIKCSESFCRGFHSYSSSLFCIYSGNL